jgi:hypothetical protein
MDSKKVKKQISNAFYAAMAMGIIILIVVVLHLFGHDISDSTDL